MDDPRVDAQPPARAAAGASPALEEALRRVLTPLARLALAHGLSWAALEDAARRALVAAADQAQAEAGLPPHRRVSRISTATGIHRREVTRLVAERRGAAEAAGARPSLVSQLFTHWVGSPDYRGSDGRPLTLPRQGPEGEPSFDALARCITQDVHPRSLLAELERLGLAELDEASDRVRLRVDTFRPGGDAEALLELLGANVGSHFDTAVDNVLGGQPPRLEQAIFASDLSAESVEAWQALMRAQWQRMLGELVPQLEAMIERDAARPGAQRHRIRLGLYTHHEPQGDAPSAAESAPGSASQRKPS